MFAVAAPDKMAINRFPYKYIPMRHFHATNLTQIKAVSGQCFFFKKIYSAPT
jgi:hypothetical protein